MDSRRVLVMMKVSAAQDGADRPLPATPEVLMPGRPLRTFTVLPHVPDKLQHLRDLAYNLWWSWNPDAVALFRRIDSDLYESVENSPIRLLSATPQYRFEQLEQDDGFLAHLDRVWRKLNDYLNYSTWFAEKSVSRDDP